MRRHKRNRAAGELEGARPASNPILLSACPKARHGLWGKLQADSPELLFGAVIFCTQPAMRWTRMMPSAALSAAMNASIVVCMFSVAAVIVTGATPLVGML